MAQCRCGLVERLGSAGLGEATSDLDWRAWRLDGAKTSGNAVDEACCADLAADTTFRRETPRCYLDACGSGGGLDDGPVLLGSADEFGDAHAVTLDKQVAA